MDYKEKVRQANIQSDNIEMEKLSLQESKRQTKERREDGLNMIRPFTFDEKKMLWDGLREKEQTLHEMAMEGFKEEQILRRLEEDEEDEVMTPEEEDMNAGVVRDNNGNVISEKTND